MFRAAASDVLQVGVAVLALGRADGDELDDLPFATTLFASCRS
jgi:hypothetical protein